MRHSTAAIALAGLAVPAALLASCSEPAAAVERSPRERPREEGLRVRTAGPKSSRFRGRVAVFGDLRPEQSALLGFAVGGRLKEIGVRRGQGVQEGQFLGALDASHARAALGQAKAGVRAAYAQYALARDNHERTEAIRSHQAAAEVQMVQAKAQRSLAAAQLASAKAQVEQAKVNLEHHALRAPFAGVVTKVPPGPGVTVAPGSPLFALEATDTLILDTSVTPAQAAGLAPGAKVRVSVPATGASTEGTLRAVVRAADSASHRIPVEIAVVNPGQAFTPHVLARAELQMGERPALELPSTCLVQREGALSVFALAEGGQARRIPVQLLSQVAGTSLVELDETLAGAQVIDMPPPDLADGMRLLSGGGP
jgi:membrane fusion protein (multidrug efflux system)